ncbi:hypothetical protein MACH09_16210 [Vibrio sp. MACH09]|nr:hypothetical protein MACH09_16210 [Vibrio sp. MACH09]
MSTKLMEMKSQNLLDSLFKLFFSVKTEMKDALIEQQLPVAMMHVKVLRLLDKIGPCTAQTLGQVIQRDKAQIARLVKDLQNNGLIARIPNPSDKRSQILVLEPNAVDLLKQMKQVDGQLIERMVQGLSEEELELFVAVTEKLAANLRQKPEQI